MERKFSIQFSLNNSLTTNNKKDLKLKFSNSKIGVRVLNIRKITAKVSDVLIVQNTQPIDSGGEVPTTDPSVTFDFTANDVVNGKFKKYHGFDTRNVTVTVFDNLGVEIDTGVSVVDSNTIEIDLSRATIYGNWSLNIEKN